MVYSKVGLLKYWSNLKLVGGNLVVACLAGDAQLQSLYLKVFHESLYALWNSSEVVVLHLLVLCRVVSHKGTSGQYQVWTCRVEAFVNEEVLLLPSKIAMHLLYVGIEIMANLGGCNTYGVQCAQQRCLVVERLSSVGDEDCRYAECVVDDEYR